MRCKAIKKSDGKRCQAGATIAGYCTPHYWIYNPAKERKKIKPKEAVKWM